MSKLSYHLTESVSKQFTTAQLDDCVEQYTRRPSIGVEARWNRHSGVLWECNTSGLLLWFFLYESQGAAHCDVRFPAEFGRPFIERYMDALGQNIRERASRRGKRTSHHRTHRRGKGS